MLYLDIDELDIVFRRRLLWSTGGFSLAWFRRQDHLFNSNIDLKTEIRDIVEKETGMIPAGPIRLLTHLRYAGYYFSPISLYYCFDNRDENIDFIVAEVNNTPWGERHCYVLGKHNREPQKKLRFRHKKCFHVSPFMNSNMDYVWQLGKPEKSLVVHIENHSGDGILFDATLTLRRKPITALNLARILLRYPIMTIQVIVLIYWQAFRLWLKRIPYIPRVKTENPDMSI